MEFNFISQSSEETSQLEEKIKALKDFGGFGPLSGPMDFNVQFKEGVVEILPVSTNTHFCLSNPYGHESFKINSLDIHPETGRYYISFSLNNFLYRIKHPDI